MKLDKTYWDNRYLDNDDAWDLAMPSPPLKAYIDQLTDLNIKILIPGCGNAYEADYLSQKGFTNITLIDLSEVPVQKLKSKYKDQSNIHLIHGDFFENTDTYDLILEQTFFCALDPSLRPAYVKHMHEVLNPKGKIVGLLFNTTFEKQGPPFGGHQTEYEKLFEPYFDIKNMSEAYNSIEPRRGNELFIILEKK